MHQPAHSAGLPDPAPLFAEWHPSAHKTTAGPSGMCSSQTRRAKPDGMQISRALAVHALVDCTTSALVDAALGVVLKP